MEVEASQAVRDRSTVSHVISAERGAKPHLLKRERKASEGGSFPESSNIGYRAPWLCLLLLSPEPPFHVTERLNATRRFSTSD